MCAKKKSPSEGASAGRAGGKEACEKKKSPAARKQRQGAARGKMPDKGNKEQAAPKAERPESATDDRGLCVAGIGASAGGLEAITELLQHLSPHPNLALVFVQHLDPRRKSDLVEILSRVTKIPVQEATDRTSLEGGRLYIMPADRDLAMLHSELHLLDRPTSAAKHLPIDSFFRSLAEDRGSRAVGVVLSGTGSDGALGLRAIKAEGGIAIAQERATARYDGMPGAAIATGHVDAVLPPPAIARKLLRIASSPVAKAIPKPELELPESDSQGDLRKLFLLLRRATGLDFGCYKQSTLQRRIARRMVLHGIDSLKHYLRYVQQTPAEVEALFEDLLINVTSFFRDPELFETLRTEVFPRILRDRSPESPLRIWVPACSTGEEAYSLAITLLEAIGQDETIMPVQIFATDVSRAGIEKARQGKYPENIAGEVSPDRLRRFFVKADGGYQIRKSIRDMCVFANQNVIRDPPFSHLDLISCRNLLIYMGPILQRQIIPSFHYALKPGGYLVLGTSETIGGFSDLFSLVDKKHKIYAKKATETRLPMQPSEMPPAPVLEAPVPTMPSAPGLPDLEKEISRIVLARYGPPGVVVDDQMRIVRIRGQTGRFLEPAPGEASWNLLKMARPGLAVELRAAMHKAQTENVPARREGIPVRFNGGTITVNLEVIPMDARPHEGAHYLVLFEEATPKPPPSASKTKPTSKAMRETDREIETLRTELASTKQTLQAIIEEHEATNEELRAANEEIQSSNEELQSTNEELTTAKEELQSTNEELTTLNEELENRNAELRQAVNDLNNLLNSVHLPILILDDNLRIRSFTPLAERIFKLIPGDVGRSIGELRLGLEVENLDARVREVVDTLNMREETVRGQDDHWYTLRIRPYRTTDDKIAGAVLALVDVTERKRVEELLRNQRLMTQGLLALLPDPVVVLDDALRVVTTNHLFDALFHLQPQQLHGSRFFDAGNGLWNVPALRTLLEDRLPASPRVDRYPVELQLPGAGRKTLWASASRVSHNEKAPVLILLVFKDVADEPSR